jgi:F-type H+-transporting ATPase subunit b
MLASSGLIKVVPGLMIWTLIAFGVTFYVLKRYAFGPIQNMIDERRRTIREALDEADHAREEARRLLEEHRKLIAGARHDAEEILGEARHVAESMRERVKAETDAERQRRIEDTRRQIEAETQRALAAIRREVAVLTLEATAKVTGKVLDRDDHRRLIDDAIKELDFSALEGSQN